MPCPSNQEDNGSHDTLCADQSLLKEKLMGCFYTTLGPMVQMLTSPTKQEPRYDPRELSEFCEGDGGSGKASRDKTGVRV